MRCSTQQINSNVELESQHVSDTPYYIYAMSSFRQSLHIAHLPDGGVADAIPALSLYELNNLVAPVLSIDCRMSIGLRLSLARHARCVAIAIWSLCRKTKLRIRP